MVEGSLYYSFAWKKTFSEIKSDLLSSPWQGKPGSGGTLGNTVKITK